jgi:hypothetical protein
MFSMALEPVLIENAEIKNSEEMGRKELECSLHSCPSEEVRGSVPSVHDALPYIAQFPYRGRRII